MNKSTLASFFLLLSVLFSELNAIESSPQYVNNVDTLVVYKDVPGLAPSDKYSIRVRSALTNNEWINVFAHKCYNRANELPQDQKTANRLNYHYQYFTADWSHTYGNIEMSKNNPVEVEITLINGFQIDGKAVYKAAAHPAHKVSKQPEVIDGKIYFTIDNPGQITIDINGQMDDHHAEINPIAPPPVSDGSQSFPIHTISLFANPILDKPVLDNPNIVFVEPGVKPSSNLGTNTILYFKPGVHNIGRNFTIFANKTYYIPGDAIVYGTFANISGSGANIKIYGSGTISGKFIPHTNYDPEYTGDDKSWKLIWSVNSTNFRVEGLSLMDCPKHTMNLWNTGNGNRETFCTWLKIVTWRSNGDGIGTADVVNDCFLRTGDDASYLKGFERKRLVFWRDVHAAAFHMANMSSNLMEVEDCDVIYNRSRDVIGDNGAIFHQRGEGQPGVQKVNLVVKNFRSEDKLANMPVFSLVSGTVGSSYSGILFQNINVESTFIKQVIEGSAQAPWFGGVIFDNVTFKGVRLTEANFKTYFNTNEYVKDIWFRIPQNFTISTNSNAAQGSVTVSPVQTTYIENSIATLTAAPIAGYEFTGWSGDTIAISNPLLLKMNSNKSITANFNAVGSKALIINPTTNGSIAVNPAGASQTTNSTVTLTAKPAIGYKLDSWSGDVAGNNSVSNLNMDADKTVSATFVKTNNFAINCGGDQYIAADGTVYVQTPTGTTKTGTVTGTVDNILYLCEKSANAPFSYDVPVDNGDYTVTLKFAEIWFTTAGRRSFNVAIEGEILISGLDIFAAAGGAFKAYDRTFKVKVTDGVLNIAFTSVINNAKVSAIKVTNDLETSIGKVLQNNEISVYPNPANDKLFINSTGLAITKIELVDYTGKLVYSKNSLNQNESLDISGLVNGIYFVKAYATTGLYSSKIIKK